MYVDPDKDEYFPFEHITPGAVVITAVFAFELTLVTYDGILLVPSV